MTYDLHGKTFRSVRNTENGEVSADTVFHYSQQGTLVWADYAGGVIVRGHLLGTVLDTGELDMRYHHVNTDGVLMVGRGLSTPSWLPDGRLRFHEAWEWLSGDRSTGTSEIEEVA